ncbi:hypothetical protein CWI38_2215p0010 [Hamiltosporidium tvaerminnensis]|uniref:Uncharacterized protein n=1 Tax=Hamiltosporidium tvaerminnensis TaxID=1176355 RepID=A0A4Q9LLL4_9MICR|nr:hypothetical protein CWI37_0511p0020 [Hamiltosporidium tvaerminnensis]TBU08836.1 hypothetical protein CWI38_2215p0010 [Hamiltosporidium tvaerminnensis]
MNKSSFAENYKKNLEKILLKYSNINDEKEIGIDLFERKSNNRKSNNNELNNRKLRNKESINTELRDIKSDRKLRNKELNNKELNNRKLNNGKLRKRASINRKSNNTESNNRKSNNKESSNRKLNVEEDNYYNAFFSKSHKRCLTQQKDFKTVDKLIGSYGFNIIFDTLFSDCNFDTLYEKVIDYNL